MCVTKNGVKMVKDVLKKAQKIRTLATIRRDAFMLSLLFLALALFSYILGRINGITVLLFALSLVSLLLYVFLGNRLTKIPQGEPISCHIKKTDAPALFQTTSVGGHSHVSFLQYKGETIRLLVMERDEFDPARIEKECERVDQVILEKWNVRTELPARALFGGARIDLLLLPEKTADAELYMASDVKDSMMQKNLTLHALLYRDEETLLLPSPAGTMSLRRIRQYIASVEMLLETLGEK